MYKKYFHQYQADIYTDNLAFTIERLFEDVKDSMSDDPRPEWSPLDDFYISVSKIATTYDDYTSVVGFTSVAVERRYQKVVKEMAFHVYDKDEANNIWKIAKKYDDFDTVVKSARVLIKKEA